MSAGSQSIKENFQLYPHRLFLTAFTIVLRQWKQQVSERNLICLWIQSGIICTTILSSLPLHKRLAREWSSARWKENRRKSHRDSDSFSLLYLAWAIVCGAQGICWAWPVAYFRSYYGVECLYLFMFWSSLSLSYLIMHCHIV